VSRRNKDDLESTPPVRPLPGSAAGSLPAGMHEYIVLPVDDDDPFESVPASRADLHQASLAKNRQFREAILQFINEHQLGGEVAWVGEAGATPVLTLAGTAGAAEALKKAPGVDSVAPALTMGLVR
jgi:hypothetical protein